MCNNVIADEVEEQSIFDRSYQSSSPDEASLVRAARNFGFEIRKTSLEHITIKINEEEKQFKLLAILEFQSERKRMSVIVEDEDGVPTVFCKGADEVLFSLLVKNNENDEILIKNTKLNLDNFSNDGLRTLVVAYRKLDFNYFLDWHKRWLNTENEMVLSTQQELRKQLSMEIEKDLILLGGTALEDKVKLSSYFIFYFFYFYLYFLFFIFYFLFFIFYFLFLFFIFLFYFLYFLFLKVTKWSFGNYFAHKKNGNKIVGFNR